MAVEPLPVDFQSLTRNFVVDGLVGAVVYHDAVNTAGKLQVGRWLEQIGGQRVGQAVAVQSIGRKRLSRNQVLAVDVGHRGRLAYVALLARLSAVVKVHHGFAGPHGAHRHGGMPLHGHTVGFIDAARLVALEVRSHAPGGHGVGHLVI